MKITDKKIVEKLIYLSKNGSSKQERMRAHAIILSNEGKKGRELATIFNVTERSILQWFRDFRDNSFKSLSQQKGRGRKRLLNPDTHKEVIKRHIEDNPHQPKKAYANSSSELNIDFSYTTFKRFLKKHSI